MTRSARIVLADDDAGFLGELKAVLEECGFLVVGTASNGRAGIALVADLEPDLAIFDVRMPVMSGTQAAAVLHKHVPWLPVVLLSAYDDEGIKEEAGSCQVAGYVVKGAPVRNLLGVLASVLPGADLVE